MKPTELLDIAIQPGHPLWDTAYNELKQLLQSQRKVTRGEMEVLAFELMDSKQSVEDKEYIIGEWLKELGLEMVE